MPAAQDQAFYEAMQRHRAGRLAEAEAAYRRLLQDHPDRADALQMLGVLLSQTGRAGEGEPLIRRAISLTPREANYHSNLGFLLVSQGRREEAAAAFRQAVALRPDSVDAHSNLGNVLKELGQADQAIAAYQRALHIQPRSPVVLSNLALALLDQGHTDEAIELIRRAISLRPTAAELHNHLASASICAGKLQEALAAADEAISLRPGYPEAFYNRGNALAAMGRMEDAIESYRRAIALRPDYAEAWHHVGNSMREIRKVDDALRCYQQAQAAGFRGHELLSNMGTVLKDMGELDESLSCLQKSLAIKADAMVESNLVYTLHFHPDAIPKSLAQAHRTWNEHHGRALSAHIRPHDNDRDPRRRLRIGYVSPDFRYHPVGLFLRPLMAHHDHGNFEIVCYSDVRQPDAVTQRLAACVDVWRETSRLPDEQLGGQIREDRIDVLVDLTMHMAASRLMVFARKPAPVQVTYLAYCSTTGLETMDYRITDPQLDPPGEDESIYIEKSIRLPRTYWCYEPPIGEIEVGPPPVSRRGGITFGCLNNYCKVTRATWAAWCELLGCVPGSRLLVHAFVGAHRQRAHELLERSGLDPGRLEFVGFLPLEDYFRRYQQIDIALDPFPYTGGTTTCDALWMGVPVVTLAGKTAVARGGMSILTNIGHPELIAREATEYARIAADLARDLPRLTTLRRSLRSEMKQSPLMNAPQFTRDIEAAYRQMWEMWCASGR